MQSFLLLFLEFLTAQEELGAATQEGQGIDLTITTKGLGVDGFTPIPQRWKAERSIGWTSRSRSLVLDYETNPSSSRSLRFTVLSARIALYL